MSLSELKKYTFKAKYANFNKDQKRRETWVECVDRSKQMMLERYSHLHEYIEQAYTAVKNKEILGSQRALQFAGSPILKKEARLYNCCASYADRPRFFQEAMYLLLCGCGVGFSVQKHHVAKLPNLIHTLNDYINYCIPDTIEGWADCIGILVNSYFDEGIYPEFSGKRIRFDYTKIRPAGAPLSYTTGKAPGPEPLKSAVERIRKILDQALQNKQENLTPIQVYDIIMHASDGVLAGGVRRSATICLFSSNDFEMISAKTGNWFNENPQRGRSNNSVVLIRDETSFEDFEKITKSIQQCGEPGYLWVDNSEHLSNPCVEIGLFAYCIQDEKKWEDFNKKPWYKLDCKSKDAGLESGWQFCNLSTINGGKSSTKEKFLEACKNAAIIGTLQAGFTNFPYLGDISEKIAKRESLLGISITGIMENLDIILNKEILQEGVKIIKKTNENIAKLIGINPAARLTCIKPEGTASCILGTSSGIHPHHSKRYFRRVQANRLETLYNHFKNINPLACCASVWSANDTDDVITFCIEVPDGVKTKKQIPAIQLLEYVKFIQENWVIPGTTKYSINKWLTHNVSNTVHIKSDEWEQITKFIFNNKKYFCGISLLSAAGDKDYQQAPFCTVYTPKEMIAYYGDYIVFVSGLIERALELYDENLWNACDILIGRGPQPKIGAKLHWFNNCTKFAKKYLNNDIRQLNYLLKDVYNWKLWLDLNREYKPVNYDLLIENEDTININYTIDSACSGGTCEIIKT